MTDYFYRIVRELSGKRLSDGSYNCLCPCHDDRNPSLNVALKEDKILLHCFAGCNNADIIAVLRERGLWPRQPKRDDPPLPPGIRKNWKGKNFTRLWIYRDGDRKILGYTARYDSEEGKDVIPYFDYRGGRWHAKSHPAPRPLYGLNLLAKAPKDLTIWIVEGEKCADALRKVHRLAVTSLGGCKAARFADWSPLAGRKVRIWPDNDRPGRKYAEEVKTQLQALMPPASIEMIDSARLNLPEKGDVVDWLKIHSPEELDSLPLEKKKKVVSLGIQELLEYDFKPREMILAPWLPTQGLAMVHAKAGTGKTFLGLGIAYAVASGTKFLKWEAPKARKVLYVDGEMAGDDVKTRVEKLIVEHDYKIPDNDYLRTVTPDVREGIIPDLGTLEGQRFLEEELAQRDSELIILDNLSCLQRTGDENKAQDWIIVQDWLLHLKGIGKTVLIVHHSGKGGAQRGTSKREDNLDTILVLKRNPMYEYEEGACFEIHYEKARGVYGPEARPFEARYSFAEGLWTMRDLKTVTYDQVVDLAKSGVRQADIADMLGKSRALVSQYIKRAKEEGKL